MMRHYFSYDLLLQIYVVLNTFSEFHDCEEICKSPDRKNYIKVIFENESYRYSHDYHYSLSISLNKTQAVVNHTFGKYFLSHEVEPEFLFKYYGIQVSKLDIWYDGDIYMFEKKVVIGKILNGLKGISAYQVEVLKDKEFIAAKWTFKGKHNGTPEVTFFIHRNGKISVYYKDISTESFQNQLEFKIGRDFQCEAGKTEHKIAVPVEWIRNGTLVEYEVIGTICPIHNSSEACKKATTSNIKCIWCEKWNTCIDSNHQDSHFFKVNGCHYKNATIETTQESGQNKSLWYLYIVIPSVIFFAVCIGWVIWRWLYKRRRYNE